MQLTKVCILIILQMLRIIAMILYVFYSDNDPYVKYEAEKEFANAITENQIVISGGGHLNSESGYTEFPELLKYL